MYVSCDLKSKSSDMFQMKIDLCTCIYEEIKTERKTEEHYFVFNDVLLKEFRPKMSLLFAKVSLLGQVAKSSS